MKNRMRCRSLPEVREEHSRQRNLNIQRLRDKKEHDILFIHAFILQIFIVCLLGTSHRTSHTGRATKCGVASKLLAQESKNYVYLILVPSTNIC